MPGRWAALSMRSAVGGRKALRIAASRISASASSGHEFLMRPGEHWHAEGQARQEHVEKPAGPGPVGRRPHHGRRGGRGRDGRSAGRAHGRATHAMAMHRALRLARWCRRCRSSSPASSGVDCDRLGAAPARAAIRSARGRRASPDGPSTQMISLESRQDRRAIRRSWRARPHRGAWPWRRNGRGGRRGHPARTARRAAATARRSWRRRHGRSPPRAIAAGGSRRGRRGRRRAGAGRAASRSERSREVAIGDGAPERAVAGDEDRRAVGLARRPFVGDVDAEIVARGETPAKGAARRR